MDLWKVHLVNSETIVLKVKKKELLKSEKKYLSATLITNETEEDILLNRNTIVWVAKQNERVKE